MLVTVTFYVTEDYNDGVPEDSYSYTGALAVAMVPEPCTLAIWSLFGAGRRRLSLLTSEKPVNSHSQRLSEGP